MEDWIRTILEVGVPIVAAVIGFIVAQDRLKERQRELAATITTLRQELFERCKKIEDRLDDLPVGFKLEINTHKDDIEEKVDENKKDVDRRMRELRNDLKELREKIDRTRESSSDFAKEAELAKVVMEMNGRFETIIRAIGKLEGTMYNERRTDR